MHTVRRPSPLSGRVKVAAHLGKATLSCPKYINISGALTYKKLQLRILRKKNVPLNRKIHIVRLILNTHMTKCLEGRISWRSRRTWGYNLRELERAGPEIRPWWGPRDGTPGAAHGTGTRRCLLPLTIRPRSDLSSFHLHIALRVSYRRSNCSFELRPSSGHDIQNSSPSLSKE